MNTSFKFSFITSLSLHLLGFGLLIVSVTWQATLPAVVKSGHSEKLVQATAINQQQVMEEVTALAQQQKAKQRAEQQRISHLQHLANEATRKRHQEQQRIKRLHLQRQLALQKQQAQERAAKQRLARIQQQQRQQRQQLAALEKKQQRSAAAYQAQQQKIAALKRQQAQKALQQKNSDNRLSQQLQQEQQQLAAAKARYIQGIVDKYNALVTQAIYQHWFVPPSSDKHQRVKVQVQLASDGKVIEAHVLAPSGDEALDQSAIVAIYKASPLPVPSEVTAFAPFKQFSITMIPASTTAV